MDYPLHCPECRAQIHGLLAHGQCPACLYPLAAHYIALDGDTWLRTPAGDSALRAVVGNIALKLIYTLSWSEVRESSRGAEVVVN